MSVETQTLTAEGLAMLAENGAVFRVTHYENLILKKFPEDTDPDWNIFDETASCKMSEAGGNEYVLKFRSGRRLYMGAADKIAIELFGDDEDDEDFEDYPSLMANGPAPRKPETKTYRVSFHNPANPENTHTRDVGNVVHRHITESGALVLSNPDTGGEWIFATWIDARVVEPGTPFPLPEDTASGTHQVAHQDANMTADAILADFIRLWPHGGDYPPPPPSGYPRAEIAYNVWKGEATRLRNREPQNVCANKHPFMTGIICIAFRGHEGKHRCVPESQIVPNDNTTWS